MKKSLFIIATFLYFFINSTNAQWTDVSVPKPYSLTAGCFNDNFGIIISSGYPFVYRTHDSGNSWDSSFINPGVNAIDVDIDYHDHVLADSSGVFLTKYGYGAGWDWTTYTLPAGDVYQMIKFTNTDAHGYAIGNSGIVQETTDYGTTWAPMSIGGSSWANDKESVGADTIIFTGFDGSFAYQGSVISSTNTGSSFQEHIMATTNSQFNGTSFINGHEGFAVFTMNFPTYKNYLIHTTNGGTSWDTVLTDTNSTYVFTDVLMYSSTEGYITNQTGTTSNILKVSGGSTSIDYVSNFALKRIYSDKYNYIFAIGEGGKVVRHGLSAGIEPNTTTLKGIYPNPTSDQLFISIDSKSEISIIDLTGKVLLTQILLPGEPISLATLSNGMYCIRVSNEKGMSSGTVIVKK